MSIKKFELALAACLVVSFCCRVRAATFNIADGDVAALKTAMNVASSNGEDDTINLAANGTYSLTTEDNPGDGLPLIRADGGHSLTINGNGATIQRSTAVGTPMFRILYIDSDAHVVLDRLTITNGSAEGQGQGTDSGEAGGIYNGGLNGNAVLSITNCTFNNNAAEYNGGAIFNTSSTLSITNSVFNNNFAAAGTGGGAIFNTDDDPILNIANCVFAGNFANADGGAIYNNGFYGNAALNITDSTFSNNSADAGGAVSTYIGTLRIANSTFSNNSASTGGGAIYNVVVGSSATVTIASSTLSQNFATDDGGGIYSEADYNGIATLSVTDSTLNGNSASDSGGGIYNQGSFGGSAALQIGNTILKKGTSGDNIFSNAGGPVTSLGYNMSDDNGGAFLTGPGDQINIDPVLGPLQNNGGPTLTHALLPGSPAIDASNPNGSMRDQRYYLRNGRPDIGAFEFGGTIAPLTMVSRKTHGNAGIFDVDLPLSGEAGVECRSGGATGNYELVARFVSPITLNGASITSGVGSVGDVSVNDSLVTVQLTHVINAQRIILTLFGVTDGANTNDVNVPMRVLLGDTNGNGSVNASDVSQTKAQVGQAVTGSNFRTDANANGIINGSDVSIVKSQIGASIP